MSITIFLATVLVLLVVLTGDALRFRFRQKEIPKNDRVLYLFCQLRRDIMHFMYMNVIENTDPLSPTECKFVRRLLNVLDGTIHDCNQHKTLMLNVRQIAKHIKMYRKVMKVELEIPDHPKIREFHERIHRLLVAAFLAYTPLIRWELALRLIVFAYRMGKQDEARRREAEDIVRSAGKIRDDARHYNVSLRYA